MPVFRRKCDQLKKLKRVFDSGESKTRSCEQIRRGEQESVWRFLSAEMEPSCGSF
jgi:hypothetical protein